MANRLQGKICLITGGTSGIGRATAEACVREGAKVVFVGRRAERGADIEKTLRTAGGEATFVQGDLQIPEDCERVVEETVALYGAVDVLVNNAGITAVKPLVDFDMEEDYEPIMNLNLRACFRTCKAALKHMTAQGRGNIVNIASIGGVLAMPQQTSYAASKAAIIQLSRTLAVEYCKKGIRVNSISPGLTLTEIVEPGSDIEKMLRGLVPGGGAGTAEGIANAVVFCASDEVPFMTGANLIIDGAQSCGPCPPLY